jgi:hypothetical protein
MDLSRELNQDIQSMSDDLDISESELMACALGLFKAAYQAHDKGQHVGAVDHPSYLKREFIFVPRD